MTPPALHLHAADVATEHDRLLADASWPPALTTPPEALGSLAVDLTLLDGRVVYERA